MAACRTVTTAGNWVSIGVCAGWLPQILALRGGRSSVSGGCTKTPGYTHDRSNTSAGDFTLLGAMWIEHRELEFRCLCRAGLQGPAHRLWLRRATRHGTPDCLTKATLASVAVCRGKQLCGDRRCRSEATPDLKQLSEEALVTRVLCPPGRNPNSSLHETSPSTRRTSDMTCPSGLGRSQHLGC